MRKLKHIPILQMDPFLTSGIIISIALALILVLLGQDEVNSLIAGLLTTIITILIDLIARLKSTEQTILGAIKLGDLLSNDKDLHLTLNDIANSYLTIQNKDFELFIQRSQDILHECRETLIGLENGFLIVQPGGKYTYGRKGVEKAQKNVKAVAYEDIESWRTEHLKNVLETNQEAIERKVEIQRIFILTHENLEQAKDVLDAHKKAGVKVYIVSPDELPSTNLLTSYLIVDDQVLVYFYYTRDGRKFTGEKISIETVEVDTAINNFDTILRRSKPY